MKKTHVPYYLLFLFFTVALFLLFAFFLLLFLFLLPLFGAIVINVSPIYIFRLNGPKWWQKKGLLCVSGAKIYIYTFLKLKKNSNDNNDIRLGGREQVRLVTEGLSRVFYCKTPLFLPPVPPLSVFQPGPAIPACSYPAL